MKKMLIFLLLYFAMLCVCVPAVAENPAVTGKVTEVEKYGHARLNITFEEFNAAGFELGDIVTVKTGTFEKDMPCFDGYYVESGGYMVRARPDDEAIAVCINYGKFAETAGIGLGGRSDHNTERKSRRTGHTEDRFPAVHERPDGL